jgi:hypothetical protein
VHRINFQELRCLRFVWHELWVDFLRNLRIVHILFDLHQCRKRNAKLYGLCVQRFRIVCFQLRHAKLLLHQKYQWCSLWELQRQRLQRKQLLFDRKLRLQQRLVFV